MRATLPVLLVVAMLGSGAHVLARVLVPIAVPAVNGVTVGSSEAETIRLLGPPVSEIQHEDEGIFGMGPTKELGWPGLLIKLCRPDPDGPYRVWRLELENSAWSVEPGPRIGASMGEVEEALGPPDATSSGPEGRANWLYYFRTWDGRLALSFSDERLTSLLLSEEWS